MKELEELKAAHKAAKQAQAAALEHNYINAKTPEEKAISNQYRKVADDAANVLNDAYEAFDEMLQTLEKGSDERKALARQAIPFATI